MYIKPEDFIVNTFTVGGPWSINYCGVELIHTPTGTSVRCSKSRSQHSNKQTAFVEMLVLLNTHTDFLKQTELF